MSDPRAAYYNGDGWRWRMRAPTHVPTMTVSDLSSEAKAAHEQRRKAGAEVVPFGFARVLAKSSAPPEPQVWEGDNG